MPPVRPAEHVQERPEGYGLILTIYYIRIVIEIAPPEQQINAASHAEDQQTHKQRQTAWLATPFAREDCKGEGANDRDSHQIMHSFQLQQERQAICKKGSNCTMLPDTAMATNVAHIPNSQRHRQRNGPVQPMIVVTWNGRVSEQAPNETEYYLTMHSPGRHVRTLNSRRRGQEQGIRIELTHIFGHVEDICYPTEAQVAAQGAEHEERMPIASQIQMM